MDVSRALLSNTGSEVVLDDPDFPYRVRASLADGAERPTVTALRIESRNGSAITSGVLSRIPVRQIAGVAASALHGGGDEARFRMLAQPRPEGVRSWPREHFERVSRVASWARQTGREGGETAAVAEFWGVCPRTARRWIAASSRHR